MKTLLLIALSLIFYLANSQPDWKLIKYTNSTTVYGLVSINKQPTESGDLVGAFVGNECRAIGNALINNGISYVTLQIQGESIENISFKIWDKSLEKIFIVEKSIQSSPGGTLGFPPNYIEINGNYAVSVKELKSTNETKVYPNPFTVSTFISYKLNRPSHVNIKIFDLAQKEIGVLINEQKNTGEHSINFDAINLKSGLYFCKIQTNNFSETIKMIHLK